MQTWRVAMVAVVASSFSLAAEQIAVGADPPPSTQPQAAGTAVVPSRPPAPAPSAAASAQAVKPAAAPAAAPAAGAPRPAAGQPPKTPPKSAAKPRPLVERLGGEAGIGTVVDEFLRRVAADARINTRFINTDLTALRGHLVTMICKAAGGSCQYTGRSMYVAHAGLQIVEEEFNALVEDLGGALQAKLVPQAEQGELVGLLGPLKSQIVDPPPAADAEHDPAQVKAATAKAAALRKAGQEDAANLLDAAVRARVRGQRNYADQLFNAADRLAGGDKLRSVELLFRAGAPERIRTKLKTMSKDTAPQPAVSADSSETDDASAKPKVVASLDGVVNQKGTEQGLVVVMLTPASGKYAARRAKHRIIEQRDRQFAPRLLAVPVGSTVSFPNFDPVFHNVFSVSPSKAFDLGIYKDGETREVKFTKEGVVQLGCNLHANMSSHVVVVAAPHYVVVGADGSFRFNRLAPGKYTLRAWSEKSAEVASRPIEVVAGPNTLTLDLASDRVVDLGTDKFGKSRGQAH